VPSISSIADIVNLTRSTVEQEKWDSVGLAQLYPDYEMVRQMVPRKVEETSYTRERKLEIGAPSSYEHSYTNHPAETAAHKLSRGISTPLVKVRTSLTFSEDEKELQGKSTTQLVDIVQMRMTKWKRDFWEGLEHDILSLPTGPDAFPDRLRGIPYWVTGNSSVTDLDMHGGDDPTGFSAGAGGITKAQEPRWPNAVAKFTKVSQDDFFDKLSQFLNRVRMMAVVPHPSITPEAPSRVIYVQEPVKRACERYFSVANENIGTDGGTYRDANYYRSHPITIWHAMSDPASPVQDATGTVRFIDWNTFSLCVHPAFDQKITGPVMLPNVPGQMVMYNESWMGLECSRRDRNMILTTDTAELQPSAS
jgi:hypothetical protein